MNDYESFKKAYSQGTDAQKESRERRFGNNENYRNFKAQWEQEQNPQPQLSNPAPVQNQFQNQTFDSGSTYNNQAQNNQFSQSNDQRQPSYDPNEVLDQSRFTDPNAQVRVQEGNARQTGQPDYQMESEARDNEIINNLNSYKVSNPEFFRDRETFNRSFNYGVRNARQQAVLDSFWIRKQDSDKISNYTTADSISEGIKNADLTKNQLNLLREQYPDLYKQWQDKEREITNLRIVNKTVPTDPTDTAHLFNNLVEKLNLQSGQPHNFVKRWEDALEKYAITRDSERLMKMQDQIYNTYDQIGSLESKIRAQSSWASESLIQARIQKATSSMYGHAQALQQGYSTILQGRSQNIALASQDLQALAQQANEDQRIFNQKLSGLGFAMQTASFETPEQKRARDFSYREKTQNAQIDLKRKEKEMEAEVSSSMYDLSVTDPKKLRSNLFNTLSSYYKQYGNIIQRSQSGVVDDIINYAKQHKVSIAEAMRKNFIEPLQWKAEYKKLMNKEYGISNERPKDTIGKWDGQDVILRYDNNGRLSIVGANSWSSSSGYQWPAYTPVSTERMQAWLQQILAQGDGSKWGQCGYFVNNYLQGLWIGRLFTDPISAKKTVVNSSTPTIGSVAVIDRSDNPNSSEAQKKYGHVGVVTKINADGSVVLKQSNKNGEEKVFTSTYRADQIYGYFDPTKGATNGTGGFDQTNIPLYEAYLTEGKLPSDAKIKAMWGLKKFTNEAQAYAISMGGDIESKAQKEEIMKLRKEFNGTTEAKNFATIKQQYDGLKASANLKTPAGDIALIFGYMKMLDPNSVVREGEFATAQNAGGIDEKIRNAYNKAKNGTRLQDSQRRDFVKNAEALYNSYAKQYNTRLEEYKSYSIEWGNVNRIGTEAVTAGYKFSSQGWVQNTQSLSETVNYSKMQSIAPKSNHSSNYSSVVGGMR